MSIPSSAEPGPRSPDESLIGDDGIVATSHRGLTYPLGTQTPAQGNLIAVAPGVGWARIAMPGSLAHINVWLLDDRDAQGEGVAIVDTGLDLPQCRAGWDALFTGPLAGRRVTRVLCTHFHPDHVGLAGWLCERFGVALWMSTIEYLLARLGHADARPEPPVEAVGHWRMAGWSDDAIEAARSNGWSRYRAIVSLPPAAHVALGPDRTVRIGDRDWRIVIGRGHTPDHACLVCEEDGLMIAGDQVLPRITSNVSLGHSQPEGDPLGDWLDSIDRMFALSPEMLVLPAHGEPFTGLHTRLAALRDGHRARLDELAEHIAQKPRRAVDCFPVLFRRELKADDYMLGTGEALAHLRRLEREGRAASEQVDGVAWWRGTWAEAA